jgi:hypothetical protein
MAKISIVHKTEYTYRNPVGLLRHKLMVRPDESHDLRLHSAALKVEPEPTGIYWKPLGSQLLLSIGKKGLSASWNGPRQSGLGDSASYQRSI